MARGTIYPKMKAAQFKKGQSGNPKGRPPLTEAQKVLRKLTLESFRGVIETVLTGNLDQLRQVIKDPESPALQVGIATAFMKAMQEGDYAIIERLAERIVGKIPDVIHLNSMNQNTNLNAQMDEQALKQILAKLESDV